MIRTPDMVGALFAGIPNPTTIFLVVGFVLAVALLVGMAVAGRGH
jgi:hypothetical protein